MAFKLVTDNEKRLFQILIEEVGRDCNGCEHYEYSTKALSHVCLNRKSEHYGWMDYPCGCKLHTNVLKLKKEWGVE